eukprot:TRINITY_DN34228_c0_g1_i1.p1 TRINITY_DN34228_c0_g1~~TRINITY_DN34228_c0_g1_i1.p1  ORF type:complete len:302 (+),score=68.34 TRINITY_DN34228_c0_g1_i1:71-976(+)
MLRCLAGICGSAGESAPQDAKLQAQRPVTKPVWRLDQSEDAPKARSLQELATSCLGELAPPGASQPVGVVSNDFQKNSARLLVVVTSSSEFSTWDAESGSLGALMMLLSWAEANGYATAVFAREALVSKPAAVWDQVLRGSPARCVSVLVGSGMLRYVQDALMPVHPLLFSRFRSILVRGVDVMEDFASLPKDLRAHMEGCTAVIPSSWESLDAQVAFQALFELLRDREDHWQQLELMKYSGFQGLKENDMPGIRRLGVDQRLQRLNRDRDNDELSRLLTKHEQAKNSGEVIEDEEEPGVD